MLHFKSCGPCSTGHRAQRGLETATKTVVWTIVQAVAGASRTTGELDHDFSVTSSCPLSGVGNDPSLFMVLASSCLAIPLLLLVVTATVAASSSYFRLHKVAAEPPSLP